MGCLTGHISAPLMQTCIPRRGTRGEEEGAALGGKGILHVGVGHCPTREKLRPTRRLLTCVGGKRQRCPLGASSLEQRVVYVGEALWGPLWAPALRAACRHVPGVECTLRSHPICEWMVEVGVENGAIPLVGGGKGRIKWKGRRRRRKVYWRWGWRSQVCILHACKVPALSRNQPTQAPAGKQTVQPSPPTRPSCRRIRPRTPNPHRGASGRQG